MSKLRALREAAEMTREQLAEAAGLTSRTIAGIELGETLPSLQTLARLRQVLGDRVVELLDDIEVGAVKQKLGRPKANTVEEA